MKKLSLVVILVLVSAMVDAGPGTVTVENMPNSVQEFLAMRDRTAVTPEGGAAVFLVALMTWVKDQELGRDFLTIALDRNNIQRGNGYKGFIPARNLNYHLNRMKRPSYHHIPYSYVKGATPDNGYQVQGSMVFTFSRNKYSNKGPGIIKVFAASSGSSSPRPITLKKNNRGIWKAYEMSSLFLNVIPPRKQVDDDL